MGGNQSSKTEYSTNLDYRNWRKESQSNGKTICTNINDPSLTLQEHFISLDSEEEFKEVDEMFELRKNDPELVSSHHLKINQDEELCSKSYNGKCEFYNRIPIKLSNITDIPFPDILHFHNQSLNGFQRLSRRYGNFRINEDCIGVNNRNVVKVWHSHQYEKPYPSHLGRSQQDMVYEIVNLIQQNTNPNSLPPQDPSIENFIYRDTNNVGFSEAKRRLEQYANLYNRGVIPSKLNCAERVGGAQRINKTYVSTKNNTSFIPQPNYNKTYEEPIYHEAPAMMVSPPMENHYQNQIRQTTLQKQRLTKSQLNLAPKVQKHSYNQPTRQTFGSSPHSIKIQNRHHDLIVQNKASNPSPFLKKPQRNAISHADQKVVLQQVEERPRQLKRSLVLNKPQNQHVQVMKPQQKIQNIVNHSTKIQPRSELQKPIVINKLQTPSVQVKRPIEEKMKKVQTKQVIVNKPELMNFTSQPIQKIKLQNQSIQPQKLERMEVKKHEIQKIHPREPGSIQIRNQPEQIIRTEIPKVNKVQTGKIKVQNGPQQVKKAIPQMNKVEGGQIQIKNHLQQGEKTEIAKFNNIETKKIQNSSHPIPQQSLQKNETVRNEIKRVEKGKVEIKSNPEEVRRNQAVTINKMQMEKAQIKVPRQLNIQNTKVLMQIPQSGMMQAPQNVVNLPPPSMIEKNQIIMRKEQTARQEKIMEQNVNSQQKIGKMQKKESDKRLAFDPSDQSPVIQKDSPQRLTMQSRSGQSNGVRGSEEINESMSSLGISNVPNRTNKQLSDKMFSEIKEESIHNTTRNFYNKYMGQDESNIEWHHNEGQSDLGKHRQFQTIKSGFNPLSSKNGTGYQDGQRNGIVYSFGNNEEGTSAAFLQKLKATETSKYNTNYQANSTNYLNENKKYSANDIGEGTTNNYASTFNYVSTVSSPQNNKQQYNYISSPQEKYSPSYDYDYEYKKQVKEEKQSNEYEYKIGEYKFEEYGDYGNYKKTDAYETTNEGSAPITQLENLEMKYSVVEQSYNVAWDPEILADLQANVHQD